MRAVEDHHVDRPGVDVRQRTKPTGTNRSNALDPPPTACSAKPREYTLPSDPILQSHGFAWPGGHGEGQAPDPIPNSAVKALCANGTAP